ncbi:MAG: rhodanese-like domain-containing protein [Chitinophagaceae bacterium]
MSIDKNATIVDVRSPDEFNSEHYLGAINIPLEEVSARIDEFKNMAKPIIAYCRSGNRSGMAVKILKQNGIADITNGGGLDDLKEALK